MHGYVTAAWARARQNTIARIRPPQARVQTHTPSCLCRHTHRYAEHRDGGGAPAPAGSAKADAEHVAEEGGRIVQAHLLKVERQAEEHGRSHERAASDKRLSAESETERDTVVLEVAVIDEPERGLQ